MQAGGRNRGGMGGLPEPPLVAECRDPYPRGDALISLTVILTASPVSLAEMHMPPREPQGLSPAAGRGVEN